MTNLQGLLGLVLLLAVAFLASNNRRRISLRTVAPALAFQVLFALAVLNAAIAGIVAG